MSSHKQIKSTKTIDVDPNAWMVTFSDLIMLLLTFFVLLLTMKSMDNRDLREMFRKTMTARGPLEFVEPRFSGDVSEKTGYKPKTPVVEESEALKQAFDLLEDIDTKTADDENLRKIRESVEIGEDVRGVLVTLASDPLFASGEAEITPEYRYILDAAAKLLVNTANTILIMGHTDDVPVTGTEFRSNLELSFYRALSVYNYMTQEKGLKPERLGVGGYGDLKPLVPNNSDGNRAKNRRVEFILRKPGE